MIQISSTRSFDVDALHTDFETLTNLLAEWLGTARRSIKDPGDPFADFVLSVANLLRSHGLAVTENRAAYDAREIKPSCFQRFMWALNKLLPSVSKYRAASEAAFHERVGQALETIASTPAR